MSNTDHLHTAAQFVHNDDRPTLTSAARYLLDNWDPNEPDCYDDIGRPALVFVALTAYINDPGDITTRALTTALEDFFEMH